MTGKLLSSVAFLTTIFALQNAQSAEIPQALTIDRLSAETVDFLNSSGIASPYELQTAKADETDVVVRIDGTTYYFTPKDAEQGTSLQTLADIGSAALKELPDSTGAVYKLGDKYYGYDAQKLPKSAYSLSEISKAEAESASYPVITKYIKNDDNTLSEKYYKVNISEIGSGDKAVYYKWEKDENGKLLLSTVTSAEEADFTVKYGESGRKVYNTRQTSLSGDIDADFIGDSSSDNWSYGGAISNGKYSTIGNITGDFINNYAQAIGKYVNAEGGAIYNYGTIGNITGNLINNFAQGAGQNAYGGAIYNYGNSTIGNITGDFINNYAQGLYDSYGGAISNYYNSTIGNITSDFTGNYAKSESFGAQGGAIYNGTIDYGDDDYSSSEIGNITGNFINNFAQGKSYSTYGGAISNDTNSTIGNIIGDFINNYAQGASAYGGAISNGKYSTIGNITGDFINNYAQGSAYGGAISNTGRIGNITGDFIGNYAKATGSSYVYGGTIYNYGTIGNVTGDFINNYAQGASSYVRGGAIYNRNGKIGNIIGDFINNYAQATSSSAYGGAIYNYNSKIGNITGDFINNYAKSTSTYVYARGGAIYNADSATIENVINSNFTDNYAWSASGTAQGGAIWSNKDILITADNGSSLFSGNKANDKSNAIYMDGANLNLSAVNKGTITFDDGINGANYNINVNGDGSGKVKFNNLVENVTNFTLSDNSVVHLGLNADIQTQNMSVASGSTLVRTNAVSSPIITVDVEVDKSANTVNSGKINLSGDVSGEYSVIVNSLNPDVLDNKDDAVVPFLFAPNDDTDTASSFSVARVIGSPYLWDGGINVRGTETGSVWYLNLTDIVNPNPEEPDDNTDDDNNTDSDNNNTGDNNPQPSKPVIRPIAPEVIAGEGLHEAAIEQTRSVVRNVAAKTFESDVKQLRNVWVLAQGETATIDKPVKMDADIWGVEAGFDVQNDVNNTLGVFASYRKGEYDLSGKADKIRSNIGSEIDIDSYLAGLYYRYDKNMNWLFATLYGGVQQADAKTDDGIAKFDTDGIEFGAGIEAGHTFALSSDLTLDPSLGLYYTQVNFDDAKDNVGKEYDWKDVKHLEAELGAKLEKQIDYAKIYVKPSVIQTITSGDSVRITGLNKLSTYDDATLGRIELGGRYGFTDALSAYGWVNYTFGSGYDATAFGAGVSYAW